MLTKLIKWFLFSIIGAPLFPLAFIAHEKGFSYVSILSNGELLLICIALSSVVIGEIVGSGRSLAVLKYFTVFGCLMVVILASIYFSGISGGNHANIRVPTDIEIANVSLYIYMFTTICSSCGIIISEV